jgi:hypothetical protein
LRLPIADARLARQHDVMTISLAILNQLPLSEIDGVVFFKRDEITTDLICCDVEVQGRVWTFHEEVDGWQALIAHLSALPDFRGDWYEAVVAPPFDASETIAFKRR